MNLKKIPIAFSLLLFATLSYGQIFDMGEELKLNIQGGGAVSSYLGSDISENTPIIQWYYGARVSYYFFEWAAIESGYGHSTFGTREVNDLVTITNTAIYHQIPLVLRVGRDLSIAAGVELNILQDAKLAITNWYGNNNVTGYYNKYALSGYADLNVNLGDFSALGISVSYCHQPILKNNFDWKPGSIRLYFSLRIF